jgi:hypothetical protein
MAASARAAGSPPAVEMTADGAFSRRVLRLALTSAAALGIIWLLARNEGSHPVTAPLLLAGWLLMPTVLLASLRIPRLRFALVVPAAFVTVALVMLSADAAAAGRATAAGWIFVTSGVLVGGTLGLWFWFRLFPVPPALRDPFSRGRWALIGIHLALVAAGLALLAGNALLRRR